ncbi:thiol-disulfide oxidoreductase DCC family protein [Flammeovirga aprica]|uniref:DUF393 domain-containing protein n=1 Tax=Flammeovirga aprica JL-4 TaxID=694437 RepID=A0A7X9RXI3_9BACT|nr:DCC1-like thiol-disulfide oxidoreductase family protein [Flammeovirga aprica]NME70508.1 DUF393 domain-containing protein [Flammeovirga aprica JL-4]
MDKTPKIVLFDGICNLCDKSVQFIIKRDKKEVFRFASLQSPEGIALLNKHHLPQDYTDSIVLIDGDNAYKKADAVLKIVAHLSFPWYLFKIGKYFPDGFTNFWYDLIAKYRYSFFEKKEDHCDLIHQKRRYTITEL